MGQVPHFTEYHWQQAFAGMLRALGADAQMTRAIVEAVHGVYGRTEVLDMHQFVDWVTRKNPSPMVGEVEAHLREYLDSRSNAA
jgi:hypothetical protein